MGSHRDTRWVLGGYSAGYSAGYSQGYAAGYSLRPPVRRAGGRRDARGVLRALLRVDPAVPLEQDVRVLRGTQGYSEYGGLWSTRVDPAVSLEQDVRVRHCKGHPEYGVLTEYSRWATLRGGCARACVCVCVRERVVCVRIFLITYYILYMIYVYMWFGGETRGPGTDMGG